MVIDSFYPDTLGGAELFAFETAKRLARKGHNISVITKRHPISFQVKEWGQSIGILPEYEEIEGIKIHRVKYHNSRVFSVPTFVFHASSKLKDFRDADIVHAHLTVSSGMAAAFRKHSSKPLLLITEQGFYRSELKYFGPLIKAALKRADHVHIVSEDLKKKIQNFGISPEKMTVIPNGVDASAFRPSQESRSRIRKELNVGDEPLAINVSRLVPKNDIVTTMRGFKRACEEVPGMKLLIIGEGPEKEALIKEAEYLGIKDSTIFLGYKPNNVIAQYYSAADIFIRTPVDEGFGIVFIEAMATGIPTIGTDVGGVPDIITNGENGLLIRAGDEQAVGEAITELVKNRDLARKIGNEGRISVESRFSWDAITDQIESLYAGMQRAKSGSTTTVLSR